MVPQIFKFVNMRVQNVPKEKKRKEKEKPIFTKIPNSHDETFDNSVNKFDYFFLNQ